MKLQETESQKVGQVAVPDSQTNPSSDAERFDPMVYHIVPSGWPAPLPTLCGTTIPDPTPIVSRRSVVEHKGGRPVVVCPLCMTVDEHRKRDAK